MCENIYVEKDDKFIVGFINSHGKLEYTEYKAHDGEYLTLMSQKNILKKN